MFGPIVSSRSFGPEPWTSSAIGARRTDVGLNSVAGSGQPFAPVVSASSVTFGGNGSAAALAIGTKSRPLSSPWSFQPSVTVSGVTANSQR